MYHNNSFLFEQYPLLNSTFDTILYNQFNYLYCLESVVNLIKPPFMIKSFITSKDLKKQIKQKFTTKITYINEPKRKNNSIKQLAYYADTFSDYPFESRLHKALSLSFFE